VGDAGDGAAAAGAAAAGAAAAAAAARVPPSPIPHAGSPRRADASLAPTGGVSFFSRGGPRASSGAPGTNVTVNVGVPPRARRPSAASSADGSERGGFALGTTRLDLHAGRDAAPGRGERPGRGSGEARRGLGGRDSFSFL